MPVVIRRCQFGPEGVSPSCIATIVSASASPALDPRGTTGFDDDAAG